jgi:hypothetical protein
LVSGAKKGDVGGALVPLRVVVIGETGGVSSSQALQTGQGIRAQPQGASVLSDPWASG